MIGPSYTQRTPDKDGRFYYKPTTTIEPEERAFWAAQYAKIATGGFPYPLKSLSHALRNEVYETRSWLNSALRHADGKRVKASTASGHTATEAYALPHFRELAQGVDDLLARCQAASPKPAPKAN